MIYAVACKEIKVVRFRGSFYLCLFLNYVKQTTKSNLEKKQDHKKQFRKKIIIKFGGGISKKMQNSYHLSNYLLTLSLWCKVAAKYQIYLNKPTAKSCCLF